MKWIPVCEIKVMFFSYKSLIPLLGSLFASVQISLFAETNFMDPTVFKSLDRIKTNTNFRTWAGSDSFPLGKCCFIAVLGYHLKNDRMITVDFQSKLFNIAVIQVYALTSNAEEAEVEWFYKDLQDFLELKPKKDVLFIKGAWNAKVGSQEIFGSNRQIWPWEYRIKQGKG